PQAFDAIAWYHCDHLGTPMELTDEQGNIAWAGQYKAWGEVREARSELAKRHGLSNPIRFQGHYQDHETSLHYNRYRYYDPKTARYVSQDPVRLEGGLNFFSYVTNPTGWVDPLGLWGEDPRNKYRYNVNGSLKSVTAKIRPSDIGTGSATNASSRGHARGMGCAGDDAGHAISKLLGGSGGKDNVFPQDPTTNRGAFRMFEGDIAAAVKNGDNVIVRVVPNYDAGGTRPTSILYQARANGVTHSQVFNNPCSCDC
uniref:RHS repeat-associated core domain-containing protein n=3 Tax=Pseudomonas TaxID=286 RepID=UPI001AE0A391